MTAASSATAHSIRTPEVARRRRRLALLLGLVVLLSLLGFAAYTVEGARQATQGVQLLKAIRDIRAGSVITADQVGVAEVRTDDSGILRGLLPSTQRSQVVGKTALDDVAAGDLIPAGVAVPASSAEHWDVPLPVTRMPTDLRAGDHVALVVTATSSAGVPVQWVTLQDVTVLGVGQGSVNLWLPAKVTAQVEWYADHGGVILAKMPPGAVEQGLPGGGPS